LRSETLNRWFKRKIGALQMKASGFKNAGKTLLALSLMGVMAGAAQAADKVLHVYNWSDYIAPDTVKSLKKDRYQGGVRRVRQQRDPGGQAAGGQVRLRHRRAVQQLPGQADQGRGLPGAGQVQAA
jgi:hypothetical protein